MPFTAKPLNAVFDENVMNTENPIKNNTEIFMQMALEKAREAYNIGEIPVGALIVRHGELIASAHNMNRSQNNPVMHAEIAAITAASAILGNERLTGCHIYVTKEPCAMCAGAIVHSRIEKVIIGARDMKSGACGSVLCVCGSSLLNHVPEIEFGVMENESAALLKEFFRERRRKSKSENQTV